MACLLISSLLCRLSSNRMTWVQSILQSRRRRHFTVCTFVHNQAHTQPGRPQARFPHHTLKCTFGEHLVCIPDYYAYIQKEKTIAKCFSDIEIFAVRNQISMLQIFLHNEVWLYSAIKIWQNSTTSFQNQGDGGSEAV